MREPPHADLLSRCLKQPAQSWELRTASISSTQKVASTSTITFPGCILAGSWIGRRLARTQTRHSDTLWAAQAVTQLLYKSAPDVRKQ